MRERAEVNKLLGIDSGSSFPDEIAQTLPAARPRPDSPTWPILGALYHPPGGIIRHDAVVWGFARGADRGGVEIHQGTEVTGIDTTGRARARRSRRTAAGSRRTSSSAPPPAGRRSSATSPASRLPITTHILQAFVTEPTKPFLDTIIVSAQMHVYVSQTDRGEFLIGAEIEPYTTYKGIGTFPFLEYSARHSLELFPQLERLRVLRTWTGLCDLSPDYSPILGRTEVDGFHVSAGWGTYGFKAAPDRRLDARRARRDREDARADRAVRARALPHRHARLRARGGGGLALSN